MVDISHFLYQRFCLVEESSHAAPSTAEDVSVVAQAALPDNYSVPHRSQSHLAQMPEL